MKTNLMSVAVNYDGSIVFEVEVESFEELFNEIQSRTDFGLDEQFDEFNPGTEEQFKKFLEQSPTVGFRISAWDDQLEMFINENDVHALEEYQSLWLDELEREFKYDDEINQDELFDKAYKFVQQKVTELFGVEEKENFFDEFKEFVKGE